MKVTAKATRSGDWWAVEVPEVPGAFTQAKRLDQVADMVRDAVSLLKDITPESIEVDVDAVVDEATVVDLAEVRSKREQAAALERQASDAMAGLAQRLVGSGLTLRDVGVVLGVSHQRVGQLLGQATVRGATRPARRTRAAVSGRYVSKASKASKRETSRARSN